MKDKMHNKNFGWNGESLAKKYYEQKGWSFIAQNLTEKGSEIDLIMQRTVEEDTEKNQVSHEKSNNRPDNMPVELLFVEVKSMEVNNKDNLTPEDNFTKSKQRFLRRGIELYLSKNKLHNKNINIRIDLACVYYHRSENKHTIKVYENIILE